MDEDNGEFPLKKLIILVVLVGVLLALLLPQLTKKSKSKSASTRVTTSAQGSDSENQPPVFKRFDKLPPKMQERLRKRFPQAGQGS